jgi:hypothetical protein
MLLPDAFLAELKPEELFLLALACHYHDLGLAGSEADEHSPESRARVRDDHAVRVSDRLRGSWRELGFDDCHTDEAPIFSAAARGQQQEKNRLITIQPSKKAVSGKKKEEVLAGSPLFSFKLESEPRLPGRLAKSCGREFRSLQIGWRRATSHRR